MGRLNPNLRMTIKGSKSPGPRPWEGTWLEKEPWDGGRCSVLRSAAHPCSVLSLLHTLQFDTNGDGEISTSELREAMRKLLGHQVGHRDIEEIIRDVDLNGDGRVDFEGKQGLTWV